MNFNCEVQHEIKCSFLFGFDSLYEQIKENLTPIYGADAVKELEYKCTVTDKGVLIQVSSNPIPEEEAETSKKRTRKSRANQPTVKEIVFEADEDTEETQEETSTEETTVEPEEETVDITRNKDVVNPTIKLPTLSDEPVDNPVPKELTPEQYRILRAKSNHTSLELISIMEYETDPQREYDALYRGKEPKGVKHPDEAATLATEVSKEELDYVKCFAVKKRIEGCKTKFPKLFTKTVDGVKLAYYRQVDVFDPKTNKTVVYCKSPQKEEMEILAK